MEDNFSERNCQNQSSHPGLSHLEQECQESLIQGKIGNQQNSNEGLEYRAYFRIQGKHPICLERASYFGNIS